MSDAKIGPRREVNCSLGQAVAIVCTLGNAADGIANRCARPIEIGSPGAKAREIVESALRSVFKRTDSARDQVEDNHRTVGCAPGSRFGRVLK